MKTKNKIMLLTGMSIAILMCSATTSNAALQANGKSTKQDSVSNWLLNVRQMESAGGTLGLTDTINTTDLTSSATTSNNLDIHMELNTEYGAMTILSASSYGNQSKINNGETTTGNKSGVYMYINKEWVSAGASDLTSIKNASEKYKNIYTTSYVAKIGDAIRETSGWHGSTNLTWLGNKFYYSSSRSGLLRACSGSIFSYYGEGSYDDSDAYCANSHPTRAVVVIGSGL